MDTHRTMLIQFEHLIIEGITVPGSTSRLSIMPILPCITADTEDMALEAEWGMEDMAMGQVLG